MSYIPFEDDFDVCVAQVLTCFKYKASEKYFIPVNIQLMHF